MEGVMPVEYSGGNGSEGAPRAMAEIVPSTDQHNRSVAAIRPTISFYNHSIRLIRRLSSIEGKKQSRFHAPKPK